MRVLPMICGVTIPLTCAVANAEQPHVDAIKSPQSEALTEFWTDQRLQEATPMPMPVVNLDGAAARGTADRSASKLRLSQTVAQGDGDKLDGPARFWVGRLAFNMPDGALRTCLAQMVAPGILITAAHCLRDSTTGQWFTNFLYVFQYQRGSGRRYSTECLTSYQGWVSKEPSRWAWDFGFVKLRGATTLGHFGWELGWLDKYQSATQVSTPATVQTGRLVKGWNENVVGLEHGHPTEGSNGGAWIARYDPAGNNPQANAMISITSHYVGDDPGTSFGPYWNDSFTQLLNSAKAGCR